ncbi:molybdopterin synthase sulfur carrier subunit [Seongchinamella sediminis]|uniref:Molybdopterin synthase sulfur carrier subunit n=1 Tax=Seongchinamella sediminis TaxID=2283635 RepID=A0A3L7DUZ0_9GAMM|nr:MoaD/ThiS family protein [Seongchinamella sediminis]RLQ20410.1 molybdopterin synthase sulfur carrier subunit [Seongchinamella sediminis]
MLTVLFFGRFREELACSRLELELDASCASLDGLQHKLVAEHGERWQRVLGQDNVIRALNQEVASGNPALADGDEIAFFPPVTGG